MIFHPAKKPDLKLKIRHVFRRLRHYYLVPVYSRLGLQFYSIVVATAAFTVGSYLAVTGIIIPRIHALTETSKSMPADFSFIASGYDTGSGTTYAISTEVRIATSSAWWNANWNQKKQLTISNRSGSIATASSTMRVTVDTKSLYDSGKLLATGDDLRVVYSTSSGYFKELVRSLTPASGATIDTSGSTEIAFPLQADITNNNTDINYYLYYGNASAPSYFTNALSFDGINDGITGTNLGTLSQFTIEAWVFPKTTGSGTWKQVVGYVTGGSDYSASIAIREDLGVYKYCISDANVTANCVSGTVSYNQWSHIAAVYDGTYMYLYQNDILVESKNRGTISSYIISHIGSTGAQYYYGGLISDVRIWNTARNRDQIRKSMGGPLVVDPSEKSNLIGYWKLNEGTGTVATDTGGSNNGTISGATWTTSGTVKQAAYNFDGSGLPAATFIAPFNGTTTAVGGQTPTTATGAIRYSGGKGALLFDGVNDTLATGANLNEMSQYTFEFWFKKGMTETSELRIAGQGGSTFIITLFTNGGVRMQGTESATCDIAPVTNGVWAHLAWSYDGSQVRCFLNGVQSNIANSSGVKNFGTTQNWGNQSGTGGAHNSVFDELRVSDAVRYTTNFTPSSAPFKSDSNTRLLLHFDENGDDPRNSGKTIDASGNGNHGTITGAKYVSGLVGVDASSTDTGYLGTQSYAGHSGVFIEEGTTNLITNPSFENSTAYNTNWSFPYFNYATASATFTAGMAKRNSAGPFAAGVMVQPNDTLTIDRGTQIAGSFYSVIDNNQGSIVFWITPEWNGNDNLSHVIFDSDSHQGFVYLLKETNNTLRYSINGTQITTDVSSWVAGNTYNVVLRWDQNKIFGSTNYYMSMSINGVHTFGTTKPTVANNTSKIYFGYYTGGGGSFLIEGLTIYRRPLYESTTPSGTNVGNGDEISQIYNSDTGRDPTLITGSWDVVFALPTNASTGSLTTGTGNAWSHPHSSNVLYTSTTNTGGFMMNGNYWLDGITNFSGSSAAISSPSAFWALNEASGTRYDSISNKNLTDNATVTSGVGKLGNAGQFTASNSEYLSISDHPDLSTGDIDFSITAWVYLDSTSSSRPIVTKNNWYGNQSEYALGYDASSDRFKFGVINVGSTNVWDASNSVKADNFGSPSISTWYFIVAWHDSVNNNLNIQVNNGTADTLSYSNGGRDGTADFRIGGVQGGIGNGYWNGRIDAVGFWKKVLSADEKTALYNSGDSLEFLYASALATSEKIFNGGYKWTNTAARQGIKYTKSSLTAGQNYVVRGLANSDGTSVPAIEIWDVTNNAPISTMSGTTTSTRTSPNNLLFTFELPTTARNGVAANCTSIEVRLLNTASSGTVYWHQIELLQNLIDNPGLEGTYSGIPPIPPAWTNNSLSDGESSEELVDIHSGNKALHVHHTAGGFNEFPHTTFSTTSGSYYDIGGWKKFISGGASYSDGSQRLKRQDTGGFMNFSVGGSSWDKYFAVGRATGSSSGVWVFQAASMQDYLVDDVYSVTLDPVSLTVAPASSSNSTETSGLRVDGADTLTQPIGGLSANSGVVKFKFTPRHNFADAAKFGAANPVIAHFYYDANNYLKLFYQSSTILRLTGVFNGTSVNADYSTPTLNAGTTYNLEIGYNAGGTMFLKVNGVQQVSASGIVAFGTVPTTAYFGTDNGGGNSNPYDGTYTSFIAVTPTENTTAPYYKFGSKSVKLAGIMDYPDQYEITATASANGQYTLSSYVYDGTSGAIGGTIDSTVAQLASGSAALTTTYTDMGGGWWRLTNTSGAQPTGTYQYGVEVKAGKTVYVDGVQLEGKTFASSYADGSLGSGYGWDSDCAGIVSDDSGTANNSCTIRYSKNAWGRVNSIQYAGGGNFNKNKFAVSLWVNPQIDYSYSTADYGWGRNHTFFHIGSAWNDYHQIVVKTSTTPGGYANVCTNSTVGSGTAPPEICYHPPASTNWMGKWKHLVWSFDIDGNSAFYINNVLINSVSNAGKSSLLNEPNIYIGGSKGIGGEVNYSTANAIISDFRIYGTVLNSTQVASLYYEGLSTHAEGTEAVDKYQSSGTYTSPVLDLSANGQWGTTPLTFTSSIPVGGAITYQTRTSADNATWSSWADVSGNNIASDPRRYLQWKASLTAGTNQVTSPVISGMTVTFVEDTTAPTNPQNTALGFSTAATSSADLTSGNWYNYATPKFTFEEGADASGSGQSSSGIASYLTLLTTDPAASPSANTGDSCYKSVSPSDRTFTVGTAPSGCTLSNNTYYLIVQTRDNSGNTATPSTLFTYKYDGSIPNAPASVSTTNVGYQATNSFTFYWPAATDNGPSGVFGYEYKTGASSGAYFDWQFTTATTVVDVPAYQEGQNFFFVRTKDVAGNYSGTTSNNVSVTSFYYNATAPTAPQNVVITPTTSEGNQSASNVFSVSWDKPATYSGEIAKYWYCVNCTPSASTMTETTAAETVNRILTNYALATQQGKNTFYLLAEDNNVNVSTGYGNRNFSAYITADFYALTVAPGAPTNLTIADASDRTNSKWKLSLAWDAPTTGGTPAKYEVYRSTDNTTFSKVGEVSTTAYTDTGLVQSTLYYYKVRAIDNAGSGSLYTATVSKKPEGKYATAALIGGEPNKTIGSTTVTFTWTTSRSTFGTIEYGKTTAYGSAASETVAVTSHSVKITGLTPGTAYHYRVQNLDESDLVGYERSTAYSSDYTFTNLASADISEINVAEVGLETAIVTWKTSSMATTTIEYGKTTNYGTLQTISTTATTNTHTARLASLEDSTTYHFRIKGTTTDNTDIFSQDNTFETITFPKITAYILKTDQNAGGTTVALAWSSNVETSSVVEYQALEIDKTSDRIIMNPQGQEINLETASAADLEKLSQEELGKIPVISREEFQQVAKADLKTTHVLKVGSLKDGTLYVFTLKGSDQYGNEAIFDPIRYITGRDTRAPVVSNIVVETQITGSGAASTAQILVSWDTDEPATTQVLFGAGVGTEYPQSTSEEKDMTLRHVAVIRDLQPTSSYHLRIVSKDQTGNEAKSEDLIAVTPASQESALDVILKNLEDVFGFITI